jgi:hypothetical protein
MTPSARPPSRDKDATKRISINRQGRDYIDFLTPTPRRRAATPGSLPKKRPEFLELRNLG